MSNPEVLHPQVAKTGPARDKKREAAAARWHVKAAWLAIGALFRLFFRVRVAGMKNVPRTPVIICANHLGWADPFLVLLFFPVEPRIYVLGLHPGRISRFRAWVVDSLQVIVALDRDKPRQALRISEDILKHGGSLLIFPEGGLGEEGDPLPLQPGAAHMSVATGAPLLPVGLTGTKELWLRRTMTIRVGKPMEPSEFVGDLRTRVDDMTERLERELRALIPGDHERPRVKLLRKWLTNLL